MVHVDHCQIKEVLISNFVRVDLLRVFAARVVFQILQLIQVLETDLSRRENEAFRHSLLFKAAFWELQDGLLGVVPYFSVRVEHS